MKVNYPEWIRKASDDFHIHNQDKWLKSMNENLREKTAHLSEHEKEVFMRMQHSLYPINGF